MKKVILLGATSNISKYLIPRLLAKNDVELTLFARQATRRLHQYAAQSQVLSRTAIGIIPLILRRQSRVKISFTWQRGISPPPIKMLSMR